MAAPAFIALVILAAPYWFEDSDRARTPAPAASPAAPSCAPNEEPWSTECLGRGNYLVGPANCTDGVVLFTEKMKAPTCVSCETDLDLPEAPMNFCAGVRHANADALLNSLYQQIAAESPAHKTELRDGERAWIKRRDAKCEKDAAEEEPHTPAHEQVIVSCQTAETTRRIAELGKLRDSWKKKKS